MNLKDMMRALDERFAKGEVSEETYKEIKQRYENEAKEQESAGAAAGTSPRERAPLIKVSGSSDYCGDMYAVKVVVSGSSDVSGSIDAEEVDVAGSCDVGGDVKASKRFRASGSCDVDGSVESDAIEVSGSCDISGNVSGRELVVSGSCDIDGNVTVDICRLSGSIDIGGLTKAKEFKFSGATDLQDVEAEVVDGRGAFEFHHMTAKKVTLRTVNHAEAKSITADEIDIKPHRSDGHLSVERLTANMKLDIEGVDAEEVSGGEVRIGPHCRIGTVQGKKVEVDPKAKVGKVVRL